MTKRKEQVPLPSMNIQSRKWQLTFQNPQISGLDHSKIKSILEMFHLRYYCMADEISASGTPHTHLFLFANSPIRFSTIHRRFPGVHAEPCCGSAQENRTYIQKGGKWKDTDKAETAVADTFEEWGEIPDAAEESFSDKAKLLEYIRLSMSNLQILEACPHMAFHLKDFDLLRQTVKADIFRSEKREVSVTYLYGDNPESLTAYIYLHHAASDICRITNYRGGKNLSFDSYGIESVLVFEHFNGQIPAAELLDYLGSFPLMLPARYSDKVACYTQVYLTSDIPPERQYLVGQSDKQFSAFINRLNQIMEFASDGTVIQHK